MGTTGKRRKATKKKSGKSETVTSDGARGVPANEDCGLATLVNA